MKHFLCLILALWSLSAAAETEQCSDNVPSSDLKRVVEFEASKMDKKRGYKPAWMALERRYRAAILKWEDESIREEYLGNENAYLDVHMYHEVLHRIQEQYSDQIEVWEIAQTHFGFPVYAILVGDSNASEKADILHLGAIHGNELIAVNYTLDSLRALLADSSATINNLKSQYNFWFIPMFNPDGNWLSMRRAHASNYGKKNGRNTDGTCETFGYEGVDLSNNFPKKNQDIVLEPETLGLTNLINSRKFVAAVSYHSGGKGLYTPSLLPTEKEGERLLITSFTTDIQQANPNLNVKPLSRNTKSREIVWLKHQRGIPAFAYDYPAQIAPMEDSSREASRLKAKQFTQSFWNSLEQRAVVMGVVVDQQNQPIRAEIRLETDSKIDHVWETLDNGQFALIFPSKDIFSLKIDIDGYISAQKKIDLRSGSANSRIVLRKEE